MFIRCPFCHASVSVLWYPFHRLKHIRPLDDGQMTDHITVPPKERYPGPLDDVPQWYTHPACGGGTGMPEEIIRSYLANPMLYDDASFCTGCNGYIDARELFWDETGQSLRAYNDDLRADYIQRTYGVDARDPATPVVVTPPAAKRIEAMAQAKRLTGACVVRVALKRGAPALQIHNESALRPEEHLLTRSGGLDVAIPKEQVEQLRGTVVTCRPPDEKKLIFRTV